MNLLVKSNLLFIGTLFFFINQLNAQINLGSTGTVLNQITQSQAQFSKQVTLISSKNAPLDVTITNYYYENGQLSMSGYANGNKNHIMIFKGTKNNLYGYVVMPNKKIAYEYNTTSNGNLIVNEVPVTKIIPVCEFQRANPNKQHRENNAQGLHKIETNSHKTKIKRNEDSHIGSYPVGTDLHKLQSRPGSEKVLYMDISRIMNGDTPKHMTKEEMWINWQIVAASFSMFDVNVTTDANVYNATAVINSGVARFLDEDGGSSATLNSFGTATHSKIYLLPAGYHYGRTTAHEIGHQLGLSHDGGLPGGDYYNGIPAFQWVPIMGNFFAANDWSEALHQWSKGEYSGSDNTEDDLEIITTNYLSFREDDISQETPIEFTGVSEINPMQNSGQIGGNNDADVFTFTIGSSGGSIDIKIDRIEHIGGGMLDVEATLYDENGNIIVTNNEEAARYANINTTLTEGNYKLEIKGGIEGTPSNGFSNYSSMGYYGISGTITDTILSTNEENIDGIGIYPNPTSGIINISLAKGIKVQHIYLSSVTGKLVFKSHALIDSIDMSEYAKGTYFLKVVTNESSVVKKVIIK